MSISTSSICSHRSCSASSSSGALKVNQVEEWRKELQSKINVYTGDLDSYLDLFVPSRTPCPLEAPDASVSSEWTPLKGEEFNNYRPLMDILNTTVASFPEDKRLSFYDCHSQNLSFPFGAFAKHHHKARPDLTVSFPGDVLPTKLDRPDWSRFSMVIEAKDTEKEDPFVEGESITRTDTLVQLAICTRSLMFAHGFLATFVLGIYGNVVRIARFDRSCAVASSRFSLKSSEGLKAIRDFFWRFVHPWEGGMGAVVGSDTTIRKLTPNDEAWLTERLGNEATEILRGVNLREGRAVRVWDDENPANPRTFILFKLLDVNARLFSRSTMVWLGIEDTRAAKENHSEGPAELRIIKEAWRQVIRIPESKFYGRLRETIPQSEWVGLPDILHGGDLGARDVERWRAACEGRPWLGDDALLDTLPRSSNAGNTSPAGVPPADANERAGIPHPMHQTFSWRLSRGEAFQVYERSHMRFVVDTVGRPLSRFKSTKELVTAIRDAIKGHRLAMECAGILHRDVSSGNILIVDRPRPDRASVGILHDFDYSSMTLFPPSEGAEPHASSELPKLYPLELSDKIENVSAFKERTGTYYFIALELINPEVKAAVHHSGHDLESFYWVLLWIVLRHAAHDHVDGPKACEIAFPYGNDSRATGAKKAWIQRDLPLKVVGNEPLSDLLEEFNDLVAEATRKMKWGKRKPLAYDAVLDIFDRALARDDWPENDAAIPFMPDKTRTNTVFIGRVKRGAVDGVGSKKRPLDVDGVESGCSDLDEDLTTLISNASTTNKRRKHGSAPLASSTTRTRSARASGYSSRVRASPSPRKTRSSRR
ncbi:hypothetical protein BD414DRAFT_530958 [Trametes punicea]|nr:hypothetical protein BD414DRAFT_530958 [Trametes punicea]